jgi:hypothetical protein
LENEEIKQKLSILEAHLYHINGLVALNELVPLNSSKEKIISLVKESVQLIKQIKEMK